MMIKKYFAFAAAFILYFILANYFFGYISPTMILFGVPCPACGMTRAGFLFLSGNFTESFRMHPLFMPTMVFLMGFILFKFFWTDKIKYMRNLSIALIICFLVLYAFRMVFMFPNHPPMLVNYDSIFHNLINLLRSN